MASDELVVWLGGASVAQIERSRRGRLGLRYLDGAFDRYQLGTPVLSVSMPLVRSGYANALTRDFFENLLPEGPARAAAALRLGLREDDVFAMLRELGRECAGALVIQRPGSPAPRLAPPLDEARLIDTVELARRLAELPSSPLGIDDEVRLSLPGVQQKLILTRRSDGRWGVPSGDVASTHILKPQIPVERWPKTVQNEFVCMRLAREVGIRAANVELLDVAGQPVLSVERFDRRPSAQGIERVHQEDACQALGIRARDKYERVGGPSLRQIARLLEDYGAQEGDRRELLRLLTFNVAVGNCDAHGKNIAFLHDGTGHIELAPAFDVMSTTRYRDLSTEMGMFVDSVQRLERVTLEHLVNEGVSWGLRSGEARECVEEIIGRVGPAIESVSEEFGVLDEELMAELSRPSEALRPRRAAHGVGSSFDFEEITTGHSTRDSRLPVRPMGGTARPVAPDGADKVWVEGYERQDGTRVKGHWRQLR